ncbi:MAG: hypothetical protein H6741_35460 [Alphaproteobacteria bacterium]|nr:hypothetical protein [Alphaproteobacteria bacterium]MCB9798006.1 hypothetical protein [Alphaproteobacteria bacterium]
MKVDEEADEDALAEAAERVRDHLVTLRGGAPFLSPFDAQLLLEWLRGGVSVSIILRALEQAAERRRAKRSRAPLSLKHARAGVKQEMGRRLPRVEGGGGSLAPVVVALRASADPQEREVAEALAALEGEGERLLEQALGVARRFFERAWDEADQAALLEQAQGELGDLAELMGEGQLRRAQEEVARDLLRQAHPLLSASHLWDTVVG